jgi:hypothetical protein
MTERPTYAQQWGNAINETYTDNNEFLVMIYRSELDDADDEREISA